MTTCELCGNPIPPERLKHNAKQRYCSRHCYANAPDTRARISRQNAARWQQWHAQGIDPTHSETANSSRAAKQSELLKARWRIWKRRKRTPPTHTRSANSKRRRSMRAHTTQQRKPGD